MFKNNLIIFYCCFTLLLISFNVESASIETKRQLLSVLQSLFGGGSQVESSTLPEPDWSSLNYKELNPETKEKNISPEELYAKVEECVKKCLDQKNNKSNTKLFSFSFRDNCVAKFCDIY